MKIRTKVRSEEIIETDFLMIYIGDERYRISESTDGRLCVNKTSDGDSDSIKLHPRYSNEVEIS